MPIVHEIEGPASVGGGCTPYSKALGEDKASGFRAELLAIVEEKGLVSGENLYIEGDARHVLNMLRDAVRLLEEVGADMVADGAICEDWQFGPLGKAPDDAQTARAADEDKP